MINISGLTPIDDPSYRYKMPRLIPKVEGRGNGIKTVIVNINDIATSLNRDPSEITKYFGFELGAQTTMAAVTPGGGDGDERYIVNGSHSMNDLQNLIFKYIESFVLCKNCHLPETHYKIKINDGTVSQKCVACGSKDLCDMTHKLTGYIFKQHKKMKSGSEGKKKDKKEKKLRGGGDETAAAAASVTAASGAGEENEEKLKKEKKKKKKAAAAAVVEDEEGNDETLEADTEAEALDSALDQFKLWLNSHPDITSALPSSLTSSQLSQLVEELRSIQTLSSLSPAYRYLILLGTLCTSQCIATNEILKFKTILSTLVLKQNQIQQRQLIAATEWLIGVKLNHPTSAVGSASTSGSASSAVGGSLIRMYPVLLKQLYDEDLIEEEVLFDWFHDELRNEYTVDVTMITDDILEQLKDASKPFIIWLQQADEEGDDDDEEEEEEEEGDEEEVEG